MDPGQLLNIGSEFVSQGSQFFGKVIDDVGWGTATAIHDVADMSEAAKTAVTKTGIDITHGVADRVRDAGRAVGIAPITDVATDIAKDCGEMTAGAINMGGGLPIRAAKGTAEIISFVAKTSSDSVTAMGWGVSAGLALAARPEEVTHKAAGIWKKNIRDTGAWLRNEAYYTMKKFSLLDALLLAIVMVILLLGMCTMVGIEKRLILILRAMLISYFPTIVTISFVVVVSTIIALLEARRYLAQLPAMRSRFTSQRHLGKDFDLQLLKNDCLQEL
jgi:hypothetical protein